MSKNSRGRKELFFLRRQKRGKGKGGRLQKFASSSTDDGDWMGRWVNNDFPLIWRRTKWYFFHVWEMQRVQQDTRNSIERVPSTRFSKASPFSGRLRGEKRQRGGEGAFQSSPFHVAAFKRDSEEKRRVRPALWLMEKRRKSRPQSEWGGKRENARAIASTLIRHRWEGCMGTWDLGFLLHRCIGMFVELCCRDLRRMKVRDDGK